MIVALPGLFSYLFCTQRTMFYGYIIFIVASPYDGFFYILHVHGFYILQYGCVLVSLTLLCFVVYSARRFVVCLTLCHFVLVFFSPFSIAITSLGEERANLSAFRMFDRFVLVWICRFPLSLDVWEGLRFVIVALPGLFSYLFY